MDLFSYLSLLYCSIGSSIPCGQPADECKSSSNNDATEERLEVVSEEEKLTTRKSKRLHSRIKEGFYADMDDSFDDSDVDDNEVSESDSDNEEDSDDGTENKLKKDWRKEKRN